MLHTVCRHLLIVSCLGAMYFYLFVLHNIQRQDITPAPISTLYLVATLPLFFALSFYRWLWIGLWIGLCILTAFTNVFDASYGIKPSLNALMALLQARPDEIATFADTRLVIAMLPGVFLGVLGCWLFRKPIHLAFCTRTAIALPVVMCASTIGYGASSYLSPYMPFAVFPTSYEYWYHFKNHERDMETREDVGQLAGYFVNGGDKPLLVILVLGESARADHFSLNGYARETNPLLKRIPNLLTFPHTTACGTMTSVSVACMLTRATRGNMAAAFKETSLLSVFNALGFQTVWLSMQWNAPPTDPLHFISSEAQQYLAFSPLGRDDTLLPYIDAFASSERNTVIVMHTIGSHFGYKDRYPKSFEVFAPACSTNFSFEDLPSLLDKLDGKFRELSDCAADGSLVTAYDNTILYTDYLLAEVIQKVRHKNALVIYVSDHGESLGDNGRFLHTHDDQQSNWHVPMLWWASDAFVRSNKPRWDVIASNTSFEVNHDNLFHSLLDCAGIDSTLIDHSLSLCRRGAARSSRAGGLRQE